MWTLIAVACTAVSLFPLVQQMRALRDFPTQCLLFVLWLRLILQAFPEITVERSFAGFSIIALFAIAATGLLAKVTDLRLLRLRPLMSTYVLVGWILITSAINNAFGGALNDLFKWIYFLGALLITYRAILLFDLSRVMYAIMWTFTAPVLLQALSVVLDHPKPISDDGSISYIGGYSHEAVFSIILHSFVCAVVFVDWKRWWVEISLLTLGVIAVYLTNYRTTIIATAPILLLMTITGALSVWLPKYRPAIMVLAGSVAIVGTLVLWDLMPARYADVVHVFSKAEVLTQTPLEFNDDERRLFSGRVYLWAQYIEAYMDGNPLQKVIGFGAHSYEGVMRLYAHNTFISYLYEFGAIGLVLLICFLLGNLFLVFTIRDASLMTRLAVVHTGFIILNLTTMPLWSTEGMTLYALLLATSWASRVAPASRQLARSVPQGTIAVEHP